MLCIFAEGDHNPELEEIISEWNLDSAIYAILVRKYDFVQPNNAILNV